jgi:ABC-type transport system involved in cytochrome c biogenesis permease component
VKQWIAFWSILAKDTRSYYLKPPNISWGLIFPLAWTGMFFIRSGSGLGDIPTLLPGVVAVSILFGTTSVLAVTVTFEKKGRSFERLLLAPIPLELLMLAKTSGAILFGIANAAVPLLMAACLADLSQTAWVTVVPTVVLIAVASTFLGLFIAVSVSEVFEDLPVWAVLPHREAARVHPPACVRAARDVRRRHTARGDPHDREYARGPGLRRARRILHRPVRAELAQRQAPMDALTRGRGRYRTSSSPLHAYSAICGHSRGGICSSQIGS